MKLSVFSPILSDKSLDESLALLSSLGVESLELGVGGFTGRAHADSKSLIHDAEGRLQLKNTFKKHNMTISALSTHCNPLHPNANIAKTAQDDMLNAIILAEQLGVDTVVTFSGCPGDSPSSKYPNWVTCPWPDDFLTILDYQWNDVLIPYWKSLAKFAAQHGGIKIAIEMHPGFCVYNPETLLRLRNAVGDTIGANFDPSHLIWQGIDAPTAIEHLGKSIYHFHAKDTAVHSFNKARNGVLDTKHYSDELNRSWLFRTVGYGSDRLIWCNMMSALSAIGYSGAVSIEHEDSLMAPIEGLSKAIEFVKNIMIKDCKPTTIGWA